MPPGVGVADAHAPSRAHPPGFEQRLRRPSLVLVCAGFAAGLALGGLLQMGQP